MSLGRFEESKYKEKKQSIIDTTSDTMQVNKNETNGYNIVSLPADYKQQKKTQKKNQIPDKNDTFTKVYEALQADEKKSLTKYETFTRNVSALNALLGEKLPMPKDEKSAATPDVALKNAKEKLNGHCMVMSFMYNKLITSIDGALKDCAEGDPLFDTLTILKESCENERDIFHDKAAQYQSRMIANPQEQPIGGCKWIDALEYVRTDVYDLDSGNYKYQQNFDGATSELFHIKNNATQEHLWFSKEHIIPPEEDGDLIKGMLNEYQFSAFNKIQQGFLPEQFDNIYLRNNSQEKAELIDLLDTLYFRYKDPASYIDALIDELSTENDIYTKGFVEFLNDLNDDEKKEMYYLLDIFQRKVTTKNNASKSPSSAKIDYGKSLNKRDVATYRLANLFGVKDLFCSSRLACIKQKNKLTKGSVMENAEGQVFANYGKKNAQMSFSTNALSQFAIIQVVDAICGQVDRHYENMHAVITKEGNVDTVKCFDNNMCLGKKEYSEYKLENWKNSFAERGNSKPVSDDLIKALPLWFTNRIYNMRLEGLSMMLCDVLEPKEIQALWKRIKGIQEHIARVYHEDYEARKKEMNSANYRDVHLKCPNDMEKDDDLRLLQSMKDFSGNSMMNGTIIPHFLMPTAKEFDKAIGKRKEQIRKKTNKPIALNVPPIEERARRLHNT